MTKRYILPYVVAGVAIASVCSQSRSFAQAILTATEDAPQVIVQEPSSKEFELDRNKLNVLGTSGDLNIFLSAADHLASKWLKVDKQSYYSILSAACSDLTSYSFGVASLSRQHNAVERYATDALRNGASMPLGMRTFFVEHLTYAPGHGLSGPTGEEWSQLRGQRLTLWLETWRQIRQRTVDNFSFIFEEPKLPPRRFISQRLIVNGVIDPNSITDVKERTKYIAAVHKYENTFRLADEQRDLQRVSGTFLPLAMKNIIVEYSSAPYNMDELKKSLDKSLLAPDVCEQILEAVKDNVRHNATSGK